MDRRRFLKVIGTASTSLLAGAAIAPGSATAADGPPSPFFPRPGFEPFPVNVDDLFAERAGPFVSLGIPVSAVERARATIKHPWTESAGGWAFEWYKIAEEFERQKEWFIASLCFGAARFPVAATPFRVTAYRNQLRCYPKAIDAFPMPVNRLALDIRYRNNSTVVMAHEYLPRTSNAPLLLVTGGVDTFKIEMHRFCTFFSGVVGVRVVVFDMPGTGESEVLMEPDSEQIHLGVLQRVRARAPSVGAFGLSYGGHWALKLGLMKKVDFAISIGGPTGEGAPPSKRGLPNGMEGILKAALGIPQATSYKTLGATLGEFTLAPFSINDVAPLLIVNGVQDPYVAPASYARYANHPKITTWMIRNDTHCVPKTLRTLLPVIHRWVDARGIANDPDALRRFRELEESVAKPLLV